MGLFDRLAQPAQGQQNRRNVQNVQPHQPTREEVDREVASIKGNPRNYLSEYGFNIPDGMTDATQITQYILRTGQVGIGRLQQVMRMIGR